MSDCTLNSSDFSDEEYIESTDKCELCGKDEDLLMCNDCQDEYLLKISHRRLLLCDYGHIYEKCPNDQLSMPDCSGYADHCPICNHNIPYVEYIKLLETNIEYINILETYMDLRDAYECWYCSSCL